MIVETFIETLPPPPITILGDYGRVMGGFAAGVSTLTPSDFFIKTF